MTSIRTGVRTTFRSLKKFVSHIPLSVLIVGICIIGYAGAREAGVLYQKYQDYVLDMSLIDACFEESESAEKGACVAEVVQRLLTKFKPSEIMAYSTASTTSSTVTAACHPIGHVLGKEAYAAYEKDVERALSKCPNTCYGACIHGAVGAAIFDQMGVEYGGKDLEHSNAEELGTIGYSFCKINRGICHAIGHLAAMRSGNTDAAFAICDRATDGLPDLAFKRDQCYRGIFMELVGGEMSLVPFRDEEEGSESSALDSTLEEKLRTGDLSVYVEPCTSVPVSRRSACFEFLPFMQAPLLLQDQVPAGGETYLRVTRACATLDGADRANCFTAISDQAVLYFSEGDSRKTRSICERLTESRDRNACTLGVVRRSARTGVFGHSYCSSIQEQERRDMCFTSSFQWRAIVTRKPVERGVCGGEQACEREFDRFMLSSTTLPNYYYGLYGLEE